MTYMYCIAGQPVHQLKSSVCYWVNCTCHYCFPKEWLHASRFAVCCFLGSNCFHSTIFLVLSLWWQIRLLCKHFQSRHLPFPGFLICWLQEIKIGKHNKSVSFFPVAQMIVFSISRAKNILGQRWGKKPYTYLLLLVNSFIQFPWQQNRDASSQK